MWKIHVHVYLFVLTFLTDSFVGALFKMEGYFKIMVRLLYTACTYMSIEEMIICIICFNRYSSYSEITFSLVIIENM